MTRAPRRGLAAPALLLVAVALAALGMWQLQRRAWKHALIASVEARIHAAPVPAPGGAGWPDSDAARDAYRRVHATGRFDHNRATLVRAVTERGGGYWVMTPLVTPAFTVLVNRGFVPPERKARFGRAGGTVTVTGLLRVSEPRGGFLRANDPAADRWYSRDVAAIAVARGLGRVAPYFIDADAAPGAGGYPVGGLTVVRFADNHLAYALTWFALAALAGWAAWRVRRG